MLVVTLLAVVFVPLELVLHHVRSDGAGYAAQDLAHGRVATDLATQERTACAAGHGGQETPVAVFAALRMLLATAPIGMIGLLLALSRGWAIVRRRGWGVRRLRRTVVRMGR